MRKDSLKDALRRCAAAGFARHAADGMARIRFIWASNILDSVDFMAGCII